MNNDNVIAFVPRQPKVAAPTSLPSEADRLMGEAFARISEATKSGFVTPVDAAGALIRHALVELFVAGMPASEIEATLRAALDGELTSNFFAEELTHEMERH